MEHIIIKRKYIPFRLPIFLLQLSFFYGILTRNFVKIAQFHWIVYASYRILEYRVVNSAGERRIRYNHISTQVLLRNIIIIWQIN